MAKITEVSIINQTTIRMDVDCKKGDEIDLLLVNKVDTSILQKKISEANDKVYSEKLNEVKKLLEEEKKNAILKETEALKAKIIELNTRLNSSEEDNKNKIELAINQKENEQILKINELKGKIVLLETEIIKINEARAKDIELAVLKNDTTNKELLAQKDETINNLKLSKSAMNVKQLGEELEKWCDNEYNCHALTGFQTCSWIKDNIVVKDEDETKGSKADYVFKVYATEKKKENELLTSVVCEMKNEDPLSKNKKKNADYYSKLDKDRKKKDCEYALLVSELEWDSYNDVPIKRINEFEKMYIVRPQYFITFLSIIASLGMKFKELILSENEKLDKFKDSQVIIDEFNKLKTELIDRQLFKMEKNIKSIGDNAKTIIECSEKIKKSVDDITETIIENIKKKIDNFNIQKLTTKINKISQED